ncbi:hypothetical protein KRP22_007309 [Phytophthora ramorum]|nr:hypothetical protein KRP22_4680 [Phytophthora ramorum]
MITSSYVNPRVDQLSPDASRVRVLTPDKRRKITHAERKEKLEEEIRLLESGVAVLKTRHLPPPLALQKDSVLRPAVVEYSALLYSMHTQQLEVAKMQSAMSRCITDQHFYPLYSRICLTNDWKERRAALMAMRDEKIRNALEFATTNSSNQVGNLDDVVVTMRRAAFYKVRRPEFPLSGCQFEDLRDAMTQWSDIMLKTMRGLLYPSRT